MAIFFILAPLIIIIIYAKSWGRFILITRFMLLFINIDGKKEDGSMKEFQYYFFFAADNGKVAFTFENERGYFYSEAECRLMYESLKTIKWN